MAFVKKTWKKRLSEYPTRRQLTYTDGTTALVEVARAEGTISQEGDAFSDANMNDLEQRIADEFASLNETLTKNLANQRVLLWTNSKPTSDFAAQKVSIDLSAYEFVEIEHLSTHRYKIEKCSKNGGQFHLGFAIPSNNNATAYPYAAYRYATVTDSGVTFTDGGSLTNTANATTNINCVPTRIWGVK